MDKLADKHHTAVGLPTVDDRPDADIVIFDGNCRFCRDGVQRLNRLDRGNRLAFISLHDPAASQQIAKMDHGELMKQMYVVTGTGQSLGGADAVKYLSRKIPRLYFLAPLLHVPLSMPFWRWLYRVIARNRYRIRKPVGGDCDSNSCDLHFD